MKPAYTFRLSDLKPPEIEAYNHTWCSNNIFAEIDDNKKLVFKPLAPNQPNNPNQGDRSP